MKVSSALGHRQASEHDPAGQKREKDVLREPARVIDPTGDQGGAHGPPGTKGEYRMTAPQFGDSRRFGRGRRQRTPLRRTNPVRR